MRSVLLLLLLMFGLAAPAVVAGEGDLSALQQANALLQAEHELSRTGEPYLVVDLPAQVLSLKASGLTLADWTIIAYRRWGHPSALPAARLVRKASLDEPERDVQVVNIAAPETETPPKPPKAFELADMPTAYRLRLDNGTDISVRSASSHWFGRLRSAVAVPFWYLSRPLISDWKFIHGSPYNELALSLTEQDARMVYWAFNEGGRCIIRPSEAGGVVAPTRSGTTR